MTEASTSQPVIESRPPVAVQARPGRAAIPWRDGLIVLALAALPMLAVLDGRFVADDFFFVTVLERITQPWLEYVAGAVRSMEGVPTTFYRPLAMASLLADVRTFASDPWAMHLVNLLLHAFTGICVWGIARRLLVGANARSGALVAALAWAWFPRRVETVAWISCRPDLLATFFGTFGLWLWIEGARIHRTPLRLAGVLAWAAALLSKESVVLLPFALIAWPAIDGNDRRDSTRGRFGGLAARLVALWPFLVVLAGYFALRRAATGALIGGYASASLTPSASTALKHLVYPLVPPLEPFNRLLTEPLPLAIATVAVALFAGVVWIAILRSSHNRAVPFGAAWAVVSALPVAALMPSLTTTFNDRLLYLSGIGFALVVGAWWARGRRPLRVAFAIALALVTLQTVVVSRRWPVAGQLTTNILRGIAAAAKALPPPQTIYVAAAPDSYRGAYVLRNAIGFALQREGVEDPARAVVVSLYLMDTPAEMPVHVALQDAATVRLRGKGGHPEVMVGFAESLPFVSMESWSGTHDRYGRREDVRLRLRTRGLVLVTGPDGVTSLGMAGPDASTDPQIAPRVGPPQ